jgi:hypothetical protein
MGPADSSWTALGTQYCHSRLSHLSVHAFSRAEIREVDRRWLGSKWLPVGECAIDKRVTITT